MSLLAGQGTGAQAQAQDTVSKRKSIVSGTVFDSTRGQVLAGASIRCAGADSESQVDGSFRLEIDPGDKCEIKGQKDGYYQEEIKRLFVTGLTQTQSDLKLFLTPLASVAGRVKDRESKSVAGMSVFLLNSIKIGGRQTAAGYKKTISDKNGNFRFEGLKPEKIILLALPKIVGKTTGDLKSYGLAVHPLGSQISTAVPIEILAGTKLADLDIELEEVQKYNIRGRVDLNLKEAAEEKGYSLELRYASDVLDPSELDPLDLLYGLEATPLRLEDGFQFRAAGVAPGRYRLLLFKAKALLGSASIEVVDRDLDSIQLVSQAPSSFQGRLMFEEIERSEKLPDELSLMGAEGGISFRNIGVAKDGTFSLDGLAPGKYRLGLRGPAPSMFIRSIRLQEKSVNGASFVVPPSGGGSVEVLLSKQFASLTIRSNSAGTLVSAVPVPLSLLEGDLVRTGLTNQDMASRLERLSPGTYLACAWTGSSNGVVGLLLNPEHLKKIEKLCERLDIKAGSHSMVQLKGIDATQL